jgi:hypothetical protein
MDGVFIIFVSKKCDPYGFLEQLDLHETIASCTGALHNCEEKLSVLEPKQKAEDTLLRNRRTVFYAVLAVLTGAKF